MYEELNVGENVVLINRFGHKMSGYIVTKIDDPFIYIRNQSSKDEEFMFSMETGFQTYSNGDWVSTTIDF